MGKDHNENGKFKKGNKAALGNRYTLPYSPRSQQGIIKMLANDILNELSTEEIVERLRNLDDHLFIHAVIKLEEIKQDSRFKELKQQIEQIKLERETGQNQQDNDTIEISYKEEDDDDEDSRKLKDYRNFDEE